MITLSELKPYLNRGIEITTVRDAKYGGTLAALRSTKQQLVLSDMKILNKDGTYTAHDKHGCSRAFHLKALVNWRVVD